MSTSTATPATSTATVKKTKKSSSSSKKASPSDVVPVETPVVSEVQVPVEKVKKTKKVKKTEEVAAPLSEEVVPESESESPKEANEETPSDDSTKKNESETEIKSILETILTMSRELRSLESRIRGVVKQHQKELKEATKTTGRRKRTTSSGSESSSNNTGIKKPVAISEALSDFLGLERGTLINRPDVTRKIFAYLREHKLQEEANKTIFKVDAALKAVLGEPIHLIRKDKPELGYGYSGTNLQTYLVPHFSNSAKKTLDAVEAAMATAA